MGAPVDVQHRGCVPGHQGKVLVHTACLQTYKFLVTGVLVGSTAPAPPLTKQDGPSGLCGPHI